MMNKLIQELAEQVGAVRNVIAMGRNDGVLFTETELEKFAELIIKQCALSADVFNTLGCPNDMDPDETGPSDYIKKQFGIK
jgi:hypothetical protein